MHTIALSLSKLLLYWLLHNIQDWCARLKTQCARVFYCTFDRVELFCLPKLKQLICGFWLCPCLPMTLGYVPCLKEVEFYGALTVHSEPFKLSEFLCGAACINTLSLDFLGQKVIHIYSITTVSTVISSGLMPRHSINFWAKQCVLTLEQNNEIMFCVSHCLEDFVDIGFFNYIEWSYRTDWFCYHSFREHILGQILT